MLRYLSPESTINVTTVAFGLSCSPILIAAITLTPDEVPAKRPSSLVYLLAIALASSVFTAIISSTKFGSQSGGVYPIPTPSIL